MKRRRDIEAEMTFLPTEHGGRKDPAFSDYRTQFYYAGRDWDARHEYPDVQQANPGDTVRAFLGFLSPDEHVGRVKPGMAFVIREGAKIIAYGSVTRLIDFETSAQAALARRRGSG